MLVFIPWKNGNWVAFGRKPMNGLFNGCLLLGMHAVACLPWGGTCQHLMVPKVALPDLEGCPQHGRECAASVCVCVCVCVPLFQLLSAILLLCSSPVGSCCKDGALLSHDLLFSQHATAPGFSGGTGSRLCLQNISLWSGCSNSCWTTVVVPPGDGNPLKTSHLLVDVPTSSHSASETGGGWRCCSCGSAEAREMCRLLCDD